MGMRRAACALLGKVLTPWQGTVSSSLWGKCCLPEDPQYSLVLIAVQGRVQSEGTGFNIDFATLGWTVCPSLLAVSTASFG